MNESRYQFSTKELLLLPIFAIAATNVNAALNYLLYDVEREFARFWFDSIASTNFMSTLPTPVCESLGGLFIRSVDMVVAYLIAIILVILGRLNQPAAVLLLITLPFSPQIGTNLPLQTMYSDPLNTLAACWPEYVTTLVFILILWRIAARMKSCRNSRTQLFALGVFFLIAALGWWKMNPRGFGGPTLQNDLKADHKSVQCGTRFSEMLLHSKFLEGRLAFLGMM